MKYALTVFLLGFSVIARAADLPPTDVLAPVVEVEEDIYPTFRTSRVEYL
jgi:hypothetical protein